MKTPLLLASALVLGACASSNPDYTSHWNAGYAGESAEHTFTGFDSEVDDSRYQHASDGAASIALTIRRHVMNDNPNNPLQMRRGWGNPDNPYNMTAGIADAGYLVRDGVVGAYYVGAEGVVTFVDAVIGIPAGLVGLDYPGIGSIGSADGGSPTEPEDFDTTNF